MTRSWRYVIGCQESRGILKDQCQFYSNEARGTNNERNMWMEIADKRHEKIERFEHRGVSKRKSNVSNSPVIGMWRKNQSVKIKRRNESMKVWPGRKIPIGGSDRLRKLKGKSGKNSNQYTYVKVKADRWNWPVRKHQKRNRNDRTIEMESEPWAWGVLEHLINVLVSPYCLMFYCSNGKYELGFMLCLNSISGNQ
jgi:hypothetical protein